MMGAISGFSDSQADRRYEEMSDLQKVLINMEIARQQEDLNEGLPVRRAERGAAIPKFGLEQAVSEQGLRTPGYSSAIIGGKMGEAQQQQAKGLHDIGTLQGKIGQTLGEQRVKTAESEARMGNFPPPGTEGRAALMANWLRDNPEHRRKMEEIQRTGELHGDTAFNLAALNNEGALARADLTGQYSLAAARERQDQMERPPQAIARLVRELRRDPNNQDARRELSYYLNGEFENDFQKDLRGSMLSIRSQGNTPQAQAAGQELEMYKTWKRADYFDRHGLDNDVGKLSFEEFQWINRVLQDPRSKGMDIKQIIEMGKRLGKIKQKAR